MWRGADPGRGAPMSSVPEEREQVDTARGPRPSPRFGRSCKRRDLLPRSGPKLPPELPPLGPPPRNARDSGRPSGLEPLTPEPITAAIVIPSELTHRSKLTGIEQ